jgi:tripartite-type tricarboxylate transporter receptor subunit TctC
MNNIIPESHSMTHSLHVTRFAALAAALLVVAPATAQNYPERPIRFIVPFSPGGTSDIVGRVLGAKLAEELGQPVVVDNRSGAGSTIGSAIAAQSPPDGYTIIVNHMGLAFNETLYPKRTYNALRDLTAISRVGDTPDAVVVNNALPVKNMKDLIALAKKQPGKLNYGSGGHGSAGHLAVALLEDVAGIKVNHVPYKGGGPSVAATMSGEVQFAIPALPTATAHAKAGRVRMLAVTGLQRSPAVPDVPTVAEAGLPGYDFVLWFGIFAPAATPRTIVTRLNAAVVNALRAKDVQQQLGNEGLEARSSTPEELNKVLKADVARWSRIIKSAGISAEQ